MTNVVYLSECDVLQCQVGVNLEQSTDSWANLIVAYNTGRGYNATVLGWNGVSLTKRRKSLLYERPEVFNHVTEFVAPHTATGLVDIARAASCPSYSIRQHMPRPMMEYAPIATFGPYTLEPATYMRGGPWLNFRILGMGKRKMRKFYGSWNGWKIQGVDWYEFQRLHPIAADHVRHMLGRTTPTQLCTFAHYAGLTQRLTA